MRAVRLLRIPVLLSLTCGPVAICAAETPAPLLALDDVIEQALSRHPALSIARIEIDESRAEAGMAAAWPNPRVEGELGRGSIPEIPEAGSATEWSWRLTQPLPWPGRRRAAIDAAESGTVAAERRADRTEAQVRADVSRQFLEAYRLQREAEVLGEGAEALRRMADLLRQQSETGEGRPLDALRAEGEALRARQEVERVRGHYEAQYSALRLTVGKELPRTARLQLPDLEGDVPPLSDLEARLRQDSPDLTETAAIREAADRRILAERRSWLPDLEISGFQSSEIDKESWGGAIGVNLPLFWRNHHGVSRAQAEARRIGEEQRLQEVELLQRVASSYVTWSTARKRYRAYVEEILPVAVRSRQITEFALREGEISLLEVLDAQRNWLADSLATEAAGVEAVLARLELERLVGGRIP